MCRLILMLPQPFLAAETRASLTTRPKLAQLGARRVQQHRLRHTTPGLRRDKRGIERERFECCRRSG